MPTPDVIIEPIDYDGNGGYEFKVRCSDITKTELLRFSVKTLLETKGHNIIDHTGRL